MAGPLRQFVPTESVTYAKPGVGVNALVGVKAGVAERVGRGVKVGAIGFAPRLAAAVTVSWAAAKGSNPGVWVGAARGRLHDAVIRMVAIASIKNRFCVFILCSCLYFRIAQNSRGIRQFIRISKRVAEIREE